MNKKSIISKSIVLNPTKCDRFSFYRFSLKHSFITTFKKCRQKSKFVFNSKNSYILKINSTY